MNPPENYTLFILGAGANVPYGFPTALGLKNSICQNIEVIYNSILGNRDDISKNQKERQIQSFENFKDKFSKSPTPSIDLFLSRNPEFENIGKSAILLTLIKSEENNLANGVSLKEPNWLEYLFNSITNNLVRPEDYKLFNTNNIKFITFNYDRLLETFFVSAMHHTFYKYHSEVIEKVRQLPIDHVYGHFGFLSWLAAPTNDGSILDYGANCDYHQITSLIKNIKLIQDRETLENNHLKELVRNANRIYFLGFSYAEENLKLLGIPDKLNDTQKIYGTAFQNTFNEIKKIKFRLNREPARGEKSNILIEDCDCLTLLRNHF